MLVGIAWWQLPIAILKGNQYQVMSLVGVLSSKSSYICTKMNWNLSGRVFSLCIILSSTLWWHLHEMHSIGLNFLLHESWDIPSSLYTCTTLLATFKDTALFFACKRTMSEMKSCLSLYYERTPMWYTLFWRTRLLVYHQSEVIFLIYLVSLKFKLEYLLLLRPLHNAKYRYPAAYITAM